MTKGRTVKQAVDPAANPNSPAATIRLRGVRVNNLKNVDLDIPHGQMLAFCGLSGSGKTSLALDTLFAEGQRRYVECFSPYTRQFLDQLEKPDADLIDGIPPAIGVTALRRSGNARSTVGTVTETIEYLRLLFGQISKIKCHVCDHDVIPSSPQSVTEFLQNQPADLKFQIVFRRIWENDEQLQAILSDIKQHGFRRVLFQGQSYPVDGLPMDDLMESKHSELFVVVDRLKTTGLQPGRCAESLETAFFYGQGQCTILLESTSDGMLIDQQSFAVHSFSDRRVCGNCSTVYPKPDAGLFSFNNPLGACSTCEGFGSVHHLDIHKIVPDRRKTVRDGAIVPWNSPAYQHELEELIEIAEHHQFPLDVPFDQLTKKQIQFLWEGDRERDFGGLNGFFAWLEKRKYKMHLRIFLARWRTYEPCQDCSGKRLNPVALSFRIAGDSLADFCETTAQDLLPQIQQLRERTDTENRPVLKLLDEIETRLTFLQDVGVGYLTLNRQLRNLSAGERQRVALTRALGSNLVNLLYVLDEPSSGLHPYDVQNLLQQITRLQNRGNTVVIVDHDPELIKLADRAVEMGPQAGKLGGEIVFDGTPKQLQAEAKTNTGLFLAGERGFVYSSERRPTNRGRIRLSKASGHNLQSVNAEFPLNVLCVVSGVSGSGKSSLARQTLAPAIENQLNDSTNDCLPFQKIHGCERVDQVAVIDQTALKRVSRSNPATYVKAWDEIRKVFATTHDAKTKKLKPGHFSFNIDGGRCDHCQGEGFISIDMQFMADILRRCEQCRGTRFKHEVCQVRYRSNNISDVLNMTAAEAFSFFRGSIKVQARLKLLLDVGLGYVPIGQPVSTLSIGEAQRLKLAAFLGKGAQKRTLFIMDEPTSGLHMADVVKLIDCFDALIDVGHSLIVIEHNLLMLANADHVIDLGPQASNDGGTIVATGSPEEICDNPNSVTGRFLKTILQKETT